MHLNIYQPLKEELFLRELLRNLHHNIRYLKYNRLLFIGISAAVQQRRQRYAPKEEQGNLLPCFLPLRLNQLVECRLAYIQGFSLFCGLARCPGLASLRVRDPLSFVGSRYAMYILSCLFHLLRKLNDFAYTPSAWLFNRFYGFMHTSYRPKYYKRFFGILGLFCDILLVCAVCCLETAGC